LELESIVSPFLFAIYLDDVRITRLLTPKSFIIHWMLMIVYWQPHQLARCKGCLKTTNTNEI